MKKRISLTKVPTTNGVYLLRTSETADFKLVYVFFVYDVKTRTNCIWFAPYPEALPMTQWTTCIDYKDYRWCFVEQ